MPPQANTVSLRDSNSQHVEAAARVAAKNAVSFSRNIAGQQEPCSERLLFHRGTYRRLNALIQP